MCTFTTAFLIFSRGSLAVSVSAGVGKGIGAADVGGGVTPLAGVSAGLGVCGFSGIGFSSDFSGGEG